MSLYDANGYIRLTVVDGSTLTGLQAMDGSYNVVLNDGSQLKGRMHPCGAYNAVVVTDTREANNLNGSINIISNGSGGYTLTTSLQGASSPPALIPLNGLVATVGDSITANMYVQNSNVDRAYASNGYGWWALNALNNRLRVPYSGNYAVSGYTLSQILSNIQTPANTNTPTPLVSLASMTPSLVIGNGGTNNIGSQSSATMQVTDKQTQDIILAIPGVRYARVGITPLFSPNALTAPQEAQRVIFNAYLAAQAAANPTKMRYIDVDSLGLTSADFADGTHPNAQGAQKIGALVASTIDSWVTAGNVALLTPAQTLVSNPTMAAGTTVATGWTSFGSASGLTITYSKDGSDRQRIQVTGTNAATNAQFGLDQFNSSPGALAPPALSEIEGILDYELVGTTTGIGGISLLSYVGTSGFSNLGQGQSLLLSGGNTGLNFNPAAGQYVARAIGVKLGAGTPGQTEAKLYILPNNGAVVNLDLRINSIKTVRQ